MTASVVTESSAWPGLAATTAEFVIVSRFPPLHDGIGKYADQLAERLATVGRVRRIGLPGSDVERVMRVDGRLRALRLLGCTRSSDQVILMWNPSFYIVGRAWDRAGTYLALGLVARRRQLTVVIHEPDQPRIPRAGIRGVVDRIERRLQRWFWGSRLRLTFHSRRQRDELAALLPETEGQARVSFVDHTGVYRPYADERRDEARRMLGVPDDAPVLLCIGFLGRHKGFDRAIDAFRRLPPNPARLYIVGSIPPQWPQDCHSYRDELRAQSADDARITVVDRYLDDVDFDRWLRAADAVVLPYRQGSSSGVAARARLLGTRLVTSDVGGLPEQLGADDVVVTSDDELAEALARLVGVEAG